MTDPALQIPDRLRVALRAAHVPQREAADILGIGQPALADKFAGRRPITIGEALKVAYLAGVDIDATADLVNQMNQAQARLNELERAATEELHRALITPRQPVLV